MSFSIVLLHFCCDDAKRVKQLNQVLYMMKKPSTTSAKPIASETAAAPTREQLVVVAERLFARHGIAGVSLREIAREAGQRNTGAVHYHFGSREGVITAIFEYRTVAIDRERLKMLAVIPGELRGAALARRVISAIFVPFADQPGGVTGDNHYARFVAQVMQEAAVDVHDIWRRRYSASIAQAYGLLKKALPDLPAVLIQHRFSVLFRLGVYAIADLEHERTSAGAADSKTRYRLQLENIIDMLMGAAVAAPCHQVIAAAQEGELASPRNPSSLEKVFEE